ncbi:MAG TPA: carboxymuconolactone decarboxylase family protein [Chloroflexi bacterium]|nr:carboxymuconolactone decarboxylase family protein [Chloroflexota bacterium]
MGAKQRLDQTNALIERLMQQYPGETKAFLHFMKAAQSGKALSAKHKELINVALAVAAQCEWCISLHVKGALDAGASRDEIMEAAFQAVLMHGGPAMMYLTPLVEAIDAFTASEG